MCLKVDFSLGAPYSWAMKTILLTLGDPGGLGPELVARFFTQTPESECRVLVLGPEKSLALLADTFWTRLDNPAEITGLGPGVYLHEPKELAGLDLPAGKATLEGGRAAGVCLELAVQLLKGNVGQGLCTCPLNKAMLQAAGFDFPGHTEFLAERLGVGRENVCMHLGGPKLKVSLVTTHPPLKDVPKLISKQRIIHCLRLTASHLATLGISGHIAVCGLNPHAGESGKIGTEEVEIIKPAIEQAKQLGIDCIGPIPADTLFHFAAQGAYPATLAMYHDQGLGPLKLLHFHEAVNITLGLPYPRTSPDHGTGYDLVGTGKADLTSFINALKMVKLMV